MVYSLIVLMFPLLVCSQMRVKSGTQVRVNDATLVTVTGDTEINSGAEFSLTGDMTINGALTNNGSKTAFQITSDEAQTGSLIIAGTASGDVTVQRFLTHDKWHYISGQTNISGNFDGLNMGLIGGVDKDQFYRWEESLNWGGKIGVWVDILNGPDGNNSTMGSEGFIDCRGYAINYITDDEVLNLSGVPFTTSQDITITKTSGSTFEGTNLVGNPFSSSIAINSNAQATNNFLDQNTGALDDNFEAIYIWNESADWNGTSNADYLTVNNSSNATFVTPGQAFMVRAANNNATINLNTNIRAHGSATFYKNSSQFDSPFLELYVNNSDNHGNSTIVTFLPGMTLGLDPSYDAGKMKGNPNIALYTKLVEDNGVDFAIQALPDLNIVEFVIPIGVDVTKTSVFEFSVYQELLGEYNIVLEDRHNSIFTNLRWDNYYAEISESGTGRFYLHFKEATAIKDGTPETNINIKYLDGKIMINNPDHERGMINLVNTSGQVLARMQMTRGEVQEFGISQPKGIYIISVITDKAMLNRKIYIH